MRNRAFDLERFLKLMALEEALKAGRRTSFRPQKDQKEVCRPPEREKNAPSAEATDQDVPEDLAERPPEEIPSGVEPPMRTAPDPEQAETIPEEPPQPAVPAAAERAAEPETAENPEQPRPEAGQVLYRLEAPESGGETKAHRSAEGTLYRTEEPADRREATAFTPEAERPAERREPPLPEEPQVRLGPGEKATEETWESGPGTAAGPEDTWTGFARWDRRWERENRRYDCGFPLF